MAETIIPTSPIDDEEYIGTIFEDVTVAGVSSLDGQTGDLTLKTVNGNSVLGEGNIEIVSDVTSVNGETGDVTITPEGIGAATSTDLQTLSDTVAGKQDTLSTTQMSAVNSGIDATKVSQIATNTQNISDEVTNRQNADINLQSQIDGLAASSDVTDIVGTKVALNSYDTSKLKDNDIVKVLQDESQSGETTYYRWSTTTQTFTLIGEEGPYYTKSEADTLLNAKVDKVAGYGLSENNFSDADVTKLSGIETGAEVNDIDSISVNGTALTPDADKNVDITVPTPVTVVQTTGTSQANVMSQDAATRTIYPNIQYQPDRIVIGTNATGAGRYSTAVGDYAKGTGLHAIAVGSRASALATNSIAMGGGSATSDQSIVYSGSAAGIAIGSKALSGQGTVGEDIKGAVAIGAYAKATLTGQFDIGSTSTTYGYNSTNYRLLTGVYDPISAHDAATKGYVDGIVGNIEAALNVINNGSSN